MSSFWDSSWEKIDTDRLVEYIERFDLMPDPIIEYLHLQNVKSVCDAGCGCGIYSFKLASNGFVVSGFDVSDYAVKIARKLLKNLSVGTELKTASVLSTGYPDNQFDAVVSRDVIDHMRKKEGRIALCELCRITRPGGIILITLDHLDREYEEETHTVSSDGDFLFTGGKWDGMVFHPYSGQEISQMIPLGVSCQVEDGEEEIIVKLRKPTVQ